MKRLVKNSLLFLLNLFIVGCSGTSAAGVGNTGMLNGVWNKFLWMGQLGFLNMSSGNSVVAFTRILVWILVFTIIFAVVTMMGGKKGALSFLNRGQGGVVAAILATITAIFLSPSVLLGVGTGWATMVALLLIGGPVVGIGFLLFKIPGNDEEETRVHVFLKLVLCVLLLWILAAMRTHVNILGGKLL